VIKRGIAQIIPISLLNCITAKNLEIWVCGKKKVDFDLLRRHTRYSGGLNEDSLVAKALWETLFSLNDQESLKFIKFCWGQERLPANDEEFDRNQIRFLVKPATYAQKNSD